MQKILFALLLSSTSAFAQTSSIYEYNPKYDTSNRANKGNGQISNSSGQSNQSTPGSIVTDPNDPNCHKYDAEFLELNRQLREQNDIGKIIKLN